jgi:hypothetical protein
VLSRSVEVIARFVLHLFPKLFSGSAEYYLYFGQGLNVQNIEMKQLKLQPFVFALLHKKT